MSDTHGSLPGWKSALALFREPDAVLHAGDVLYHGPRNAIPGGYTPMDLANEVNAYRGTLFFSRGNCDADIDQTLLKPLLAPFVAIWWNGRKILMMHGDKMPLLRQMAFDARADLVISGHTHVPGITRDNGVMFLNPGSVSIPKGGDPASAAIVNAEGVSVLSLGGKVLYNERW